MRARELKAARKRLGLSQQALADTLEVHRVTIALYETGKDPIPKMVSLAVEALETRAAGTRKTA